MANLNKLARNSFKAFIVEEERKEAAWKKAIPVPGRSADLERWDRDYRLIRWDEYGCCTEYGWEIEHIIERAIGGSDELHNLRARHWEGVRGAGAAMQPDLSHSFQQRRSAASRPDILASLDEAIALSSARAARSKARSPR